MTPKQRDERTLRVVEAIRQVGAEAAVLTSEDAVCYATGHEARIEVGRAPLAGGPGTAIVMADGTTGLVVVSSERDAAAVSDADVIVTYEGSTLDPDSDPVMNYRSSVQEVLGKLNLGAGAVAIQPETLVHPLAAMLGERARDLVPITGPLRRARATKTAMELDRLRECAHLTDVGQQRFREVAAPGLSELEIFGQVRTAMETVAGHRVPVLANVLCGVARTSGYHGWPTNATAADGAPAICDLAPRVGGYWGDSCNTVVMGEPTPAFHSMYEAVGDAFEAALEMVRPGVVAGDIDARARAVVGAEGFAFPHHTGHSIGTSVHEHPRIVPGSTAVLAEDMVLLIEPGAYDPGVGGVRLEWMVQVTASGPLVLSTFPHSLEVVLRR